MPVVRKKGAGLNLDGHIKKQVTRNVTDFLNKDYREYVHYVIQTRALPSIWDGFKVGARKIMHAAFKGGMKNGAEIKVPNLVGDVYNHTLYMHGDASIVGTINTLAGEFKDNLNPITIGGQHGSLRDTKAISAPRYLYCKLSQWAKLYKVDEDLLEYVFDEGTYVEPFNYFPIIPTVLTSRSEGMAPGYKFSSFSYNPYDITKACIEVLEKEQIKTLIRPYVRGIIPENFVYDEATNKWTCYGKYKVDEKNDILNVTDLPYDVEFDKFEKKLNGYIDSGYIKDWKNYSHDTVIDYRILFNKSKLGREMEADRKLKTLKKFSIFTPVPDDILYVLDENNKVHKFNNKEDLVVYFVNLRLTKYNDRKERLVKVLTERLETNDEICKFIELVNNGTIIISNRPQKEVKKDLDKYKLSYSVLTIQISKLTDEERKEIIKKSEDIRAELEYIKNTTIKDMYINDLKALLKELKGEFA